MTFSVWQIKQKCIEQQKPHDQVFVDLTKNLILTTEKHCGK